MSFIYLDTSTSSKLIRLVTPSFAQAMKWGRKKLKVLRIFILTSGLVLSFLWGGALNLNANCITVQFLFMGLSIDIFISVLMLLGITQRIDELEMIETILSERR